MSESLSGEPGEHPEDPDRAPIVRRARQSQVAGDDQPPVLHKEDLVYTAIEMKQRSYK